MHPLDAFKRELMVRRVASKFVEARGFSSPDALKEYLKDHPNADKSKHYVEKEEKGEKEAPEKKEEKGDHGDDHGGHGPKKSLMDRIKSLPAKAKKFVETAPKTVQKFLTDESFRKETIDTAKKVLKELPEKTVKAARDAVKHEAHEFKAAAEGIHTVLKGGKMTKEQKKAVKVVAFDVALTVAVAAVSGGLGAGLKGMAAKSAAVFSKSTAKKIALNTVTHGLGNAVTLEELDHLGHGILHMIKHAEEGKKGKPDDRDLMVAYITKLVHDEMGKLSDDDLMGAVEDAASEEE